MEGKQGIAPVLPHPLPPALRLVLAQLARGGEGGAGRGAGPSSAVPLKEWRRWQAEKAGVSARAGGSAARPCAGRVPAALAAAVHPRPNEDTFDLGEQKSCERSCRTA